MSLTLTSCLSIFKAFWEGVLRYVSYSYVPDGGVVKLSDTPHHLGASGRHIDVSTRVLK